MLWSNQCGAPLILRGVQQAGKCMAFLLHPLSAQNGPSPRALCWDGGGTTKAGGAEFLSRGHRPSGLPAPTSRSAAFCSAVTLSICTQCRRTSLKLKVCPYQTLQMTQEGGDCRDAVQARFPHGSTVRSVCLEADGRGWGVYFSDRGASDPFPH